jgi:hypothetical protein
MIRKALVLALFLSPLVAPVQVLGCTEHEMQTQAASCAQGSEWSSEDGKCVPVNSS